jgi:uncharacterized membrane protein
MTLIVLLAVHLLAAVFWVGGMAFALWVLRPATGPLDPLARLPLWRRVFERFFPWVGIAVIALLVSGIAMVSMDFGGFVDASLYISLMMTIGIVMMLLFGHLYFALWPRFRKAVDGGAFPDASAALDRIRRTVTINLALGIVTIVIGGTGRYW